MLVHGNGIAQHLSHWKCRCVLAHARTPTGTAGDAVRDAVSATRWEDSVEMGLRLDE